VVEREVKGIEEGRIELKDATTNLVNESNDLLRGPENVGMRVGVEEDVEVDHQLGEGRGRRGRGEFRRQRREGEREREAEYQP